MDDQTTDHLLDHPQPTSDGNDNDQIGDTENRDQNNSDLVSLKELPEVNYLDEEIDGCASSSHSTHEGFSRDSESVNIGNQSVSSNSASSDCFQSNDFERQKEYLASYSKYMEDDNMDRLFKVSKCEKTRSASFLTGSESKQPCASCSDNDYEETAQWACSADNGTVKENDVNHPDIHVKVNLKTIDNGNDVDLSERNMSTLNEEYIAECNSDIETFYDMLLSHMASPDIATRGENLDNFQDDCSEIFYDCQSDSIVGESSDLSSYKQACMIDCKCTNCLPNYWPNGYNHYNQYGNCDLQLSCSTCKKEEHYEFKISYSQCACGDMLMVPSLQLDGNEEEKLEHKVDPDMLGIESHNEVDGVCDIDVFQFGHLPEEIVDKIMSYLTPQELLKYVAPVCKWWLSISQNPRHWTELTVHQNTDIDSILFHFAIKHAPLLKYLSISSRAGISIDDIIPFSTFCPNISSLDLSFCNVLPETVFAFILNRFTSLESLNLGGGNITDTFLERMSMCRSPLLLHDVNLSYCTSITDKGLAVLARCLPRITTLNIDGVQWITDSGIMDLVEYQHQHLETLWIDGEQLRDRSIWAVSSCSKLRKLSIWFCVELTDTALDYIKELRELRDLTIRKGELFTDAGLQSLFAADDRFLSNLTAINISECRNATDDVITTICSNLGGQLQKLSVAWCWEMTEKAADTIIQNCRYMTCLNLMGIWMETGTCFSSIPTTMPYLRHMSLENCRNVEDDLVRSVVNAKPDLRCVDYYGVLFEPNRLRSPYEYASNADRLIEDPVHR